MQKNNTKKIIRAYVDEFLQMGTKELILNPEEKTLLGPNSYISRKSLKYITHSRQQDNYNSKKICEMIIRCGKVTDCPELRLPNHNPKYPGSMISTRLYGDEGALLVVHIPDGNIQRIFNAFYRSQEKYEKMLSEATN